jgi:hypothetical protein
MKCIGVEALIRLLLFLDQLKEEHLKYRGHIITLRHILLELELTLLLMVLLDCLCPILFIQNLLQFLRLINIFSVGALHVLHLQEEVLKALC